MSEEITLINITHPQFARGYEEGRRNYLASEERHHITDEACVSLLKTWVLSQDEDALYWHLGRMFGEISGRVLPQEVESRAQRRQQILAGLQSFLPEGSDTEGILQRFEQIWSMNKYLREHIHEQEKP